MRKTPLVTGEIYHVYNRGVDTRSIVKDHFDLERFLIAVKEFNTVLSIGSIYENRFQKINQGKSGKPLVKIIAFCVNENHYHFILEQLRGAGISKFMHKLGMGYTKYFNIKHKRSGALFQGNFKSAHLADDEGLLRLSVYVNWNDWLHRLGHPVSKSGLVAKSLDLYLTEKTSEICSPEIVLRQFKSRLEYKKFANDLLPILLEQKIESRESDFLEDLE